MSLLGDLGDEGAERAEGAGEVKEAERQGAGGRGENSSPLIPDSLLLPQCPMTAVDPLGETPRPFGFGSPPDARSSLPLPLTTETAKTGAASPHCLPNAQSPVPSP
ncbi:hypothetical protein [Nostoc sp.]|uniref:hypothetical protein n=1 Tax=Nostoc sp. TaxID=1180 RepID=UPI002FFC3F34